MAAVVRAYDWASTSRGPIECLLRTAVGMMLSSAFPKCIVWEPKPVTNYNDAFRPILGDKPEALGRPFLGNLGRGVGYDRADCGQVLRWRSDVH